MKLSYAITVCNESRDLFSLVSFLLKVKDEEDEINMLAFNLGNIKIKSLHGSFSGFSIEVDRKISINLEQWDSLTKIARMCIAKKK